MAALPPGRPERTGAAGQPERPDRPLPLILRRLAVKLMIMNAKTRRTGHDDARGVATRQLRPARR